MKRFRFPLRPVAVLRAHHEIRAREAFAASVHSYVKSEEFLNATRARVAQFEAALFAGRRTTFNPAEEAQQLAAYRRECTAEGEAERATFAARAEMDRCRTAYLDAHRKLEVVKRLESKAREDHRLEANREEQAEFDDFATRRAMRRSPLFSS
ncbi:MAG: flagellar FliJ family protein [Verrucomicrobia bacterium]|nr:flagellar FliJ family protein [Verrucomicrobiota bacterium]